VEISEMVTFLPAAPTKSAPVRHSLCGWLIAWSVQNGETKIINREASPVGHDHGQLPAAWWQQEGIPGKQYHMMEIEYIICRACPVAVARISGKKGYRGHIMAI